MDTSPAPWGCSGFTWVLMITWVFLAAAATPLARGEETVPLKGTDKWQVRFDPKVAGLELVHPDSGARIAGRLSFAGESKDRTKPWSIVQPRDSVVTRLAILDPDANVQGYVTFGGTADVLYVTVVHRAAQSYKGTLNFQGTAELGRQTFACRTRPLTGSRVVQMASGPADSALNDSLFDVLTDTALRMSGRTVSIGTQQGPGETARFDVCLLYTSPSPRDS